MVGIPGAGLFGTLGDVVFAVEPIGALICGRTTIGGAGAGLEVAPLPGLVVRSGIAGEV